MYVCGHGFREASVLRAEYTLQQVSLELKGNVFENGKSELYISLCYKERFVLKTIKHVSSEVNYMCRI